MEIKKIRINGEKTGLLLHWLREEFREVSRCSTGTGTIHIFGGEANICRIGSDLLNVIVLDLKENSGHIIVVSGGSSTGPLPSATHGPEKTATGRFLSRLQEICEGYSLVIGEAGEPVFAGMPGSYI